MLNISNIITISVSTPPAGLAPYSINNLACFTKDTPIASITDYAVYTNSTDVLTDWGSSSEVYKAAVAVFAQSPNIKTGGGKFVVFINGPSEDLADAIARVKDTIYFGGCSYTYSADAEEVLAAATYCQSISKLLFVVSYDSDDLEEDGLLYDIQDQTLTKTRGLYYSSSTDSESMKWAYAGRGMSTNFSGSNTAQTMNLKQLSGISSDDISQTVYGKAEAVGSDIYVSIAGRSSVISFGANSFFDDEYNMNWFIGALEVAGFNYLATTSTKIPQTEEGMNGLKGAYRAVCQRAVSNRFVAPGTWNSGDTFGDPEDFVRNIADFGFYIYSSPIAEQSQAEREARESPLVQIAIKFAGAIHTTEAIININK